MAKAANSSAKTSDGSAEDGEFTFTAPQQELDVEDTCCITGEEVTSSFCRFPDYRRATMMVMSKKHMLEHLRKGTTIETFKDVLVKRHGKKILAEYKS